MASLKSRDLITGCVLLMFLALCFHFQQKSQAGPWHSTAAALWQNEEWGKVQALGDNLFRVGKEDVESYYLAMLASHYSGNAARASLFAERLSATRMLNWRMETQMAKIYSPDSLRKRIALFRTKSIYSVLLTLMVLLAVSYARNEPYRVAAAILSLLGIIVLFL